MRRTALRILTQLRDEPLTVSQLAERVEKNQGWVSELVSELEEQHLVEKNRQVHLADTYEAALLVELMDTYNLETILAGKREDVLRALLAAPRTVAELETAGFAASTVYQVVNDLQSAGVVERTPDNAYWIVDETLRAFLTASGRTPGETVYQAGDETVVVTSGEAEGDSTAFSAFQRYGVDYYPTRQYRYRGERDLSLEDVLVHAVLCAENTKQMAMCGVFYLMHRATLESNELWRLAGKWDCVERFADLLAYLDQRDVKQAALFLPWDEFTALAREYGVYPRGKHPEESLLDGLEELGDTLEQRVDAYLLGGGNLILRGLKDTTKDIDVVLADREAFRALAEALQALGYEVRRDLEEAYRQLAPSIVLEKEGFPRWDIFVDVVANALHLTGEMQERSDEHHEFGNLHLHLLSLTDIFLFKAVTDREGDLEDAALVARPFVFG